MGTLPDQFDLWVRKARSATPERQIDFLLGSLFAQREWYFLNQGNELNPSPVSVVVENAKCLVVFSALGKLQDFVEETTGLKMDRVPHVSIPVPAVADYCLEFRTAGVTALLVNPGDFAFTVTLDAVETFATGWRERRADMSHGFWIPNMTSEEEDFWQEHGL